MSSSLSRLFINRTSKTSQRSSIASILKHDKHQTYQQFASKRLIQYFTPTITQTYPFPKTPTLTPTIKSTLSTLTLTPDLDIPHKRHLKKSLVGLLKEKNGLVIILKAILRPKGRNVGPNAPSSNSNESINDQESTNDPHKHERHQHHRHHRHRQHHTGWSRKFGYFEDNELVMDQSMKLALITVLLCVIGTFLHNTISNLPIINSLYYRTTDLENGRLWTPFTYWIFHAGFSHVFFNLLALVPAAPLIADVCKTPRNYFTYIGGAALASVVFQGLHDRYIKHKLRSQGLSLPSVMNGSERLPAIGASGVALAFMGFVLAFCYRYPFFVRQNMMNRNHMVYEKHLQNSYFDGFQGWMALALLSIHQCSQLYQANKRELRYAILLQHVQDIESGKKYNRNPKKYNEYVTALQNYKLDSVQHAAHVGGTLFGVVTGFIAVAYITRTKGSAAYQSMVNYLFRSRFRPRY